MIRSTATPCRLLVLSSEAAPFEAMLRALSEAPWTVHRVEDLATLRDQVGAPGEGAAPQQVALLDDGEWLAAPDQPTPATWPCAVSCFGAPLRNPTALLSLGITGWWPAALLQSPAELHAALALDAARWQLQRTHDAELARLRAQLDERKWVDRAKGVLMGARAIGEDEAFRLLRDAAMHANLRVGQVSRSVTEAAQWADAVNRAGQLRMLSQRVLKLAAQGLARIDARRARVWRQATAARAQENLDHLTTMLPGLERMAAGAAEAPGPSTESLQAARSAWAALTGVLAQRPTPGTLAEADALGEAACHAAEALTAALEARSGRRVLRLVNLCGRQRMHVQRIAKQTLLAVLLDDPARRRAVAPVLREFEAALLALETAPLSSPTIRLALDEAREEWGRLLQGLDSADGAEGRVLVARSSDALMEAFDRLTSHYEHSLQVIMS